MEESHVFITRAFHYQTALNRHILCLSTPAEIEGDFSHLLIKFHYIVITLHFFPIMPKFFGCYKQSLQPLEDYPINLN